MAATDRHRIGCGFATSPCCWRTGPIRPPIKSHFRSVFEELHGIPFNMIDLPLAGECQVIEAVLLLLALPTGDFTRPELLKVLTHPAVRARFPEANTDRWREWCLDLEIVHGADRLDHDGTYIDRELFHWEQGLRRLVLGTFMSGSQSGDDRVYELGELAYSPYDQPGDVLADVGRLLVLVRSLVADARFARSAQLTMTEWSMFFVQMVNSYLAAGSETEQRALSQCLEKIQGLREPRCRRNESRLPNCIGMSERRSQRVDRIAGPLPCRRSRCLADP